MGKRGRKKRKGKEGKGERGGRVRERGDQDRGVKGGGRVFLDFLAALSWRSRGEPLGNAIYCQ